MIFRLLLIVITSSGENARITCENLDEIRLQEPVWHQSQGPGKDQRQ